MERGYVLARLQLKYGQLGRFNEIMAHLVQKKSTVLSALSE